MFDKDICVIDFETTGTLERTKPTRVTEIGIVKLNKDVTKVLNTFHTYVNPEEPLDEFIVKYTGLTGELLKDKPTFKEVQNDLTAFIDGKNSTIAAWPLSFEMPILQWEYANAGVEFPLERRGIDIGSIAAYYLFKNNIKLEIRPDAKHKDLTYSMDNMIYTLGLTQIGKRHSALGDAETEAQILTKVLQ